MMFLLIFEKKKGKHIRPYREKLFPRWVKVRITPKALNRFLILSAEWALAFESS